MATTNHADMNDYMGSLPVGDCAADSGEESVDEEGPECDNFMGAAFAGNEDGDGVAYDNPADESDGEGDALDGMLLMQEAVDELTALENTQAPSGSVQPTSSSPPAAPTDQAADPDYAALFIAMKIVQFHLDLEYTGPGGALCQITVSEVNPYDPKLPIIFTFSKYIKPPANAPWSRCAMETHGLHKDHRDIKDADPIQVVWPAMIYFMESKLDNGAKRGCICAWSGAACDIGWFFSTTEQCREVDRHLLRKPKWTPFFWDPLGTIKNYTSCPLNITQTGAIGYSLGVTYCNATEEIELEGAHDSEVDVQAQVDICRFLAGSCGVWGSSQVDFLIHTLRSPMLRYNTLI